MEVHGRFRLQPGTSDDVDPVVGHRFKQRQDLVFFGNFKRHGAVVGRTDRGERLQPVALAAGKQTGKLVFAGHSLFRFAAIGHQIGEQTHCDAAEAVADQMDLLFRRPAFKQRLVIGAAEAAVAEFFGVRLAVIDRRAHQPGIHFARAVPRGGDRADRQRVAFIIVFLQEFHQIAGAGAPVGDFFVQSFVHAPAEHAVYKNHRVLVLCFHNRNQPPIES